MILSLKKECYICIVTENSMKYKKPFLYLHLSAVSLMTLFVLAVVPASVYAVNMTQCPDGTSVAVPAGTTIDEACKGHNQSPNKEKDSPGNQEPKSSYNADVASSAKHQCGSGKDAVQTTINFGCQGEKCVDYPNANYCQDAHSAIVDVLFAIIRFLSYGVGLVVVGSIVAAGIQYTTSRGDPQATANAEKRIKATVAALLLYIFAYAILNYVIPKGFFDI